jgi:hypothetical protein
MQMRPLLARWAAIIEQPEQLADCFSSEEYAM